MSDLSTEDLAEVKEAANKAAKIGSSKMTERVAKLLRQAEGAPEGSPEREAFMERALALSAAYSIDLAIARAHTAKKERVEVPEERTFKTGDYSSRGRQKSGSKHMTDLMLAILDANDCKALIGGNGIRVFGHGMPSDLDLSERLFVLLSAQMVSEADAALKRGDNKEVRRVLVTEKVEIPLRDRDWGGWDSTRNRYYSEREDWEAYQEWLAEKEKPEGEQPWWVRSESEFMVISYAGRNWENGRLVKPHWPPTHKEESALDENGEKQYVEKVVSTVDGRVWRANFYDAFISKIRTRLREAKKQAMKDAGIDITDESDSRTLALRDKKKEVEDSYREHYKVVLENIERRGGGGYRGAETKGYSHGARLHGERKAAEARLGNEKDLDHG